MKQTSKQHRSSTILRLALTLGFLVALPVGAADQPKETIKKYPPYPDLWGYELPWPREDSRATHMSFFKMPDGDYFFTYVKESKKRPRPDGKCCDFDIKHAGRWFFSGNTQDFSDEELNSFGSENRKYRLPVEGDILKLRDGATVEQRSRAHSKCYVPFPFSILKKNATGTVVMNKTLVYLPKRPIREPIKDTCEGANGRNYVDESVQPVFGKFVPLEDETFLFYESGGNIILRFDKELATKYPINERIFLLDTEWIAVVNKEVSDLYYTTKALTMKHPTSPNQELIDRVYGHVLEVKSRSGQ